MEEKSDGNPFIQISAQTMPRKGEVVAVGEGNWSEMIKVYIFCTVFSAFSTFVLFSLSFALFIT